MKVERIADRVAAVACVWFAFTALWGINAQPHVGHIGSAGAAIAMTAENSLRWHSIYPLYDWFAKSNPYPQSAYCHHPFGFLWTSEIIVKLFGHRDFVTNLPSALMSVLTAPLLYKTCKQAWGPIPGLAGVLGFVGLPIIVGFSIFHNLEVMTIFGVVLFFFGQLRYQARGRRRDLLWLILGALVATSGDWAGYMILAPFLAWTFVRAVILPSWLTPPIRWQRYMKAWALSVALSVGTAVLWVALFKRADKLTEWISTADSRGGGADQNLSKVLEGRATWIDFSFTPWAIWLGKLALPVALLRWCVARRDEEVISLSVLLGATAQYVMFKQGADVHIFWPQYYGLYFGYAVAQLVATAEDLASLVATRLVPQHRQLITVMTAGVVAAATTLPQLPDGARSLKIWRQTGGKYDDKGTLFRSQADLLYVVKQVLRPRAAKGETVSASSTTAWGWEHDWALDASHDGEENPSPAHRLWIARLSGLGTDHLRELAKNHHLRIYGDTVIVDSREVTSPLDAYAEREREPNLLEWMFTNNNEPVRSLSDAPDAFTTWEWRDHLGQPAFPPTQGPVTLEEIRIAHNAAVATGNVAEATRLLDRIRASVDRTKEAHFQGGHELIGVRLTHGVRPMVEMYVVAGTSMQQDTSFAVRSNIVHKAAFSLIPMSPVECDHAFSPPMPTKLWKAGYVYKFEAALNHRIGLEEYWATWAGGPARLHGDPKIELAYVP